MSIIFHDISGVLIQLYNFLVHEKLSVQLVLKIYVKSASLKGFYCEPDTVPRTANTMTNETSNM